MIEAYQRPPASSRLPDGRWQHNFSQSMLGTADLCLEQVRRTYHPEAEAEESGDAALYGKVVHHVIEQDVRGWLDDQPWTPVDAMFELWQAEFWPLTEAPNYQWLSLKRSTVERDARLALEQWRGVVAPQLFPIATEQKFKLLPLVDSEDRVITLSGAIDFVDRHLGLVDFKTAGRKYERWEKQRWAIQPTVYTWAARQQSLACGDDPEVPFTYFVFIRGGDVQELTVTRNAGDWEWLRRKAENLALLAERVGWDEHWPVNDTGWWCSPKWCDAFSECKGHAYESQAVEWRQ